MDTDRKMGGLMDNNQQEKRFVMHKAQAQLPSSMDLQMREERMAETQKQAYVQVHKYRDRVLTSEDKIKPYTHLLGKMWFLNSKGELDYLELRIDIEVTVMIDNIYSGSIVVQKYTMFHQNKVVSVIDYEKESSEMEALDYRTYAFSAKTFPDLVNILSNYFINVWVKTLALPDDYNEKFPNYTLNGYDLDITKDHITIKEEDDDETLELKNNLIGALKAAYNKNFLPLISSSKLYTAKPSVAMSGNKKEESK